MTFANNLYLVVGGFTLLMPVCWLLWPRVLASWGKVSGAEVSYLLAMTGFSFVPGFAWATRGLMLMDLAVYVLLYLRQRRKEKA